MRILITEEALETGKGHWPNYLADLAGGMRKLGDHVAILAHQNTPSRVLEDLDALPVLTMNCRTDPRSRGIVGFIKHNLSYWRQTQRHLSASGRYDWILQLSTRKHHLIGSYLLARSRHLPPEGRILLLFVQGLASRPGRMAQITFSHRKSTMVAQFLLRLLRPEIKRGRIVLAAETRNMVAELAKLSGCPVVLFPHPVEGQDSGDTNQEPGDGEAVGTAPPGGPTFPSSSGGYSPPSDQASEIVDPSAYPSHLSSLAKSGPSPGVSEIRCFSEQVRAQRKDPCAATGTFSLSETPAAQRNRNTERPASEPITIFCPGFARHEKGSDLLQEAILEILASTDSRRFRFILQWPEAFQMPDGSSLGPSPALTGSDSVTFHNKPLDQSSYLLMIRRSDFVILPYRSASYHNRVSRVAIEAASCGVPMIFTRETWIREVAVLAGAGIEITDESTDSIVQALRRVVLECDSLRNRAAIGAPKVSQYYSAAQFRETLLNLPFPRGAD